MELFVKESSWWRVLSSSQELTATATLSGTSTRLALFLRWPSGHQPVKTKISPRWLARLLLSSLDAKGGVLVWHNIVLVVGIERLMLRRDVDLLGRQFDTGEVLEQIGVVGGV